jgi:hypothetical protein
MRNPDASPAGSGRNHPGEWFGHSAPWQDDEDRAIRSRTPIIRGIAFTAHEQPATVVLDFMHLPGPKGGLAARVEMQGYASAQVRRGAMLAQYPRLLTSRNRHIAAEKLASRPLKPQKTTRWPRSRRS